MIILAVANQAGLDHPVWTQLADVSYSGPTIVSEGEEFTLHCRMSIFDAVRWTRNGRLVSEQVGYSIKERTEKKLTRVVSLVISAASGHDSGDYRCNSFSRLAHRLNVISYGRDASSPTDQETDQLTTPHQVLKAHQRVIIACNQPAAIRRNKFKW